MVERRTFISRTFPVLNLINSPEIEHQCFQAKLHGEVLSVNEFIMKEGILIKRQENFHGCFDFVIRI